MTTVCVSVSRRTPVKDPRFLLREALRSIWNRYEVERFEIEKFQMVGGNTRVMVQLSCTNYGMVQRMIRIFVYLEVS